MPKKDCLYHILRIYEESLLNILYIVNKYFFGWIVEPPVRLNLKEMPRQSVVTVYK